MPDWSKIAGYYDTNPPPFDVTLAEMRMRDLENKRKQDNIDAQNAYMAKQKAESEFLAKARSSQAGQAILGQYLSPGTRYAEGFSGSKSPWDSNTTANVFMAMQKESALLGKMKAQESTYDKAFAEAQKAQEMAKTKTGVIEAGSAAQKVIGGGTGAGQEKAGAFKGIYGTGSLLPASWMQSKLDPTKVAQKISGLEDRSGTEQLRVGGGDTSFVNLTYDRSKFEAPTLQKTGLGRYATIK